MNSITTQDTIVTTLSGAKDAVVNTISQAAQTVYPAQPSNSTPQPPRGVPPSEDCSLGKVAYEDKTITGKISENIENIQTSFSSLRRPSLEALIDLQNEGLPQPPRGAPPSDESKGFVSNQDKTYLTRVSENLPTIPSLPLPSWSDYRQEINAFYVAFPQTLTDTVNQAKATIGLAPPSSAPVTAPNPPHGIPPSDADSGFVANKDKPIQLQLEENWETLRNEFMSLWTQSKRKLGWNWVQPGSVPEPPRGLAPSDDNSNGLVSDRDKTLVKNIDDAVTQFRDVAQKAVDGTVSYVRTIGTVQTQTNESGVPTPPHGVPPAEGLALGVVSEQDKTIQQKVGEAWQQVKEVVNNAITDKPNSYTIGNPQNVITDGEL